MKPKSQVLSVRIPSELRAAIDAEVKRLNKQRKTGIVARLYARKGEKLPTITRIDVLGDILQKQFSPSQAHFRESDFLKNELVDVLRLIDRDADDLRGKLSEAYSLIRAMPPDGRDADIAIRMRSFSLNAVQKLITEINQEISSWPKASSINDTSEVLSGS